MAAFVTRRLVGLVIVLFGVSLLTFAMVHLVPGDPVAVMLGDQATPADIARLRAQLGLDRPLPEQYLAYVSRAVRGDLGQSIRTGQAVTTEIGRLLGATLELTFTAMVIAVVLGITLGTVSATSRSRLVEFLASSLPLVGLSMPTFWSGLLLISLFALHLRWVPVVGGSGFSALILPAIALALPSAAVLARMTRSTMIETLSQDFIRTARSKGAYERTVTYKHALRNALIPVVTLVSLQVGGLLGGAVITESVFARPGIGRLAVSAILTRDFPIVQGIVLLAGLVYVFANFAADLAYSALDPRIARR